MKMYPILISDDGLHLHIKVKIQNKSAWMMVDTGASNSVFDIEKIEHILKKKTRNVNGRLSAGLGVSDIQSKKIKIESFKLGKLEIVNQSFTCLDLAHLNVSYESLDINEVVGVLGSDVLYVFQAIIDYSKSKLILHEPVDKIRSSFKTIRILNA